MRSVRWVFMLSHPIAQSHMTFLFASWNLIGKCVSIIACAFFFLPDKKFTLNCTHKFCKKKNIFANLGVSIQRLYAML